jgi:hypothetical protein
MNALETVAGHADRLDAAADAMAKDGVGLHDTRGHVATLRRMASSMRADAASGRVPHAFTDNFYASAAVQQLPAQILKTLAAAGISASEKISAGEFDAKATGIDPHDRLRAKLALDKIGMLG